ncbi:MAG: 16S rRNA (guanine(527)-N(7))-methyltransferase RsmG [Candidatus Shikimatogenerans bostrichidophilus]|nr:MAG: 16S rRNA (guanine(527)-N(7))-methyltransferase RsmG [Candidatus Shikimatogenerans bostrichidophilus]
MIFLNKKQLKKILKLKKIYFFLNKKINLISKNSFNSFINNHIKYSLSIINLIKFLPNSKILDVGTGGGFPGIPLSIFFKKTNFYLLDSKKKKIFFLKKIIKKLKLKNIKLINSRIENFYIKFDFLISRYFSNINNIYYIFKKNIKKKSIHYINNGIIYLTGENKKNIKKIKNFKILYLKKYFKNNFFLKKKIIYIPI